MQTIVAILKALKAFYVLLLVIGLVVFLFPGPGQSVGAPLLHLGDDAQCLIGLGSSLSRLRLLAERVDDRLEALGLVDARHHLGKKL